jgi:hypothetical protein
MRKVLIGSVLQDLGVSNACKQLFIRSVCRLLETEKVDMGQTRHVQVPSNVACRNNSAPHVQLSGCAEILDSVSPRPRRRLRHHSRILTRSYNPCLHLPTTPS